MGDREITVTLTFNEAVATHMALMDAVIELGDERGPIWDAYDNALRKLLGAGLAVVDA